MGEDSSHNSSMADMSVNVAVDEPIADQEEEEPEPEEKGDNDQEEEEEEEEEEEDPSEENKEQPQPDKGDEEKAVGSSQDDKPDPSSSVPTQEENGNQTKASAAQQEEPQKDKEPVTMMNGDGNHVDQDETQKKDEQDTNNSNNNNEDPLALLTEQQQEDATTTTNPNHNSSQLGVVMEDSVTSFAGTVTTADPPFSPLSERRAGGKSSSSGTARKSKKRKESKSSSNKDGSNNSHRSWTIPNPEKKTKDEKERSSSGGKGTSLNKEKKEGSTRTRTRTSSSNTTKEPKSPKKDTVAVPKEKPPPPPPTKPEDDPPNHANYTSNYVNNDSVKPPTSPKKLDDSTSSNYDGFEDGDQDLLAVDNEESASEDPMEGASSTPAESSASSPPAVVDEPPLQQMPVEWMTPGVGKTNTAVTTEASDDQTPSSPSSQRPSTSKEALYALHLAAAAAQQFEKYFGSMKNSQLENMTPLYHFHEVLAGKEPLRFTGYFTEYSLTAIRIVNGKNSTEDQHQQKIRRRFMERSIDGYYSVKYVQAGLIEATDHGGTAAADMIYETRILMNLRPQHPNVTPIYGVNCGGIDSFLETASADSPKAGFFFITDRIVTTLPERIEQWRKKKEKESGNSQRGRQARKARLEERMSIAFDIASAMVFLHNRNIVYHIRPDKIGFDAKQGIAKLCNFSQARYNGMKDHQSHAITRSDDISILAYTAPEALCKAPCTTACDVYGFSILLWELMSLRVPFEGYDRARHFHQVVQQHKRPPLNKKWSKEIRELLPACWDPYSRYPMKRVNEILEQVLMTLSEEQNQINQQKSSHSKRSKSKTPSSRTAGGVSAAAAAVSSVSRRMSTTPGGLGVGEDDQGSTKMVRRNSTGAPEALNLDQAKAKLQQQQKTQAPDSPKRNRPRRKLKRQNSADGITKLKDHFKAAKKAAAVEEAEADAATYAPGGRGRNKAKVDNSDSRSVSSSASAFLRSPYKSPRRSSLSHVPAGVRRQPLFRRKQDDPTLVLHEENKEEEKEDGDDKGGTVSGSTTTQSLTTAEGSSMGSNNNATQVDPPRDSPKADVTRSSSPSPKVSASPMRAFRKKLTSMKNALSGQGRSNVVGAAPLLDDDESSNALDHLPNDSTQPLRPPSPSQESAGSTGQVRRSSFTY